MDQLTGGVESEHLILLAGLDLEPVDKPEVLACFEKACEELGLKWPDEKQALWDYALLVCKNIIHQTISPLDGLAELSGLWSLSDYEDERFCLWDELAEDISLLDGDYGPIFNIGLHAGNIDDYIRRQAAQFICLAEMELPTGFSRCCYCRSCGAFGRPESARIRSALGSRKNIPVSVQKGAAA